MNSCLLVAGEKSGEEHALSFFPELVELCPDTRFYGVGGDELSSRGMELMYHLRDFSSMGFSEVFHKIPFYFHALRRLEEEALMRGTRTAILVDFQDFNLRLAKRLSRHGIKVLYYVAPQAWAWKPGRARALGECVHSLFAILPFEKKWFLDRGVEQVRAVPHPLMLTYKDELSNVPVKPYGSWKEKLKVLLLPGSRTFEVKGLLPEFVGAIKILKQHFPVEVHLVKVGHLSPEIYRYYEDQIDVFHESQGLATAMRECHVAFAASGTVTLSTGLFSLPTVVCYKSSLLNEYIFHHLIKYRGPISLTNIVHGKMIFPELTQGEVSPQRLARVIRSWIEDETAYNEIKSTLNRTRELLSGENFSIPLYISQVINERN